MTSREDGRLRVLVAFSSPLDAIPLDVEAERKAIAGALADGDHPLVADFLPWTTAGELQAALGRGYDVLHLSGHGTEAGELVLEKPTGEGHCLNATEVVKLLPAAPDRCPQLVILAMCHSGEAGQALYKAGVSHVVAIERKYPIYDRAATAYARGFYAALARGDRLGEAHEDGCRAAALEWCQKSVAIKEKLGDQAGLATTLHNMGYVALAQNDLPLALELFTRSRDIYTLIGLDKDAAEEEEMMSQIQLMMELQELLGEEGLRALWRGVKDNGT